MNKPETKTRNFQSYTLGIEQNQLGDEIIQVWFSLGQVSFKFYVPRQ